MSQFQPARRKANKPLGHNIPKSVSQSPMSPTPPERQRSPEPSASPPPERTQPSFETKPTKASPFKEPQIAKKLPREDSDNNLSLFERIQKLGDPDTHPTERLPKSLQNREREMRQGTRVAGSSGSLFLDAEDSVEPAERTLEKATREESLQLEGDERRKSFEHSGSDPRLTSTLAPKIEDALRVRSEGNLRDVSPEHPGYPSDDNVSYTIKDATSPDGSEAYGNPYEVSPMAQSTPFNFPSKLTKSGATRDLNQGSKAQRRASYDDPNAKTLEESYLSPPHTEQARLDQPLDPPTNVDDDDESEEPYIPLWAPRSPEDGEPVDERAASAMLDSLFANMPNTQQNSAADTFLADGKTTNHDTNITTTHTDDRDLDEHTTNHENDEDSLLQAGEPATGRNPG